MSDTNPGSLYQMQFEQARQLFDDGHLARCIANAKKNLEDPTLPRFYIIRNCMLIVSALEDWDEADIWLASAEHCYRMSMLDAKRQEDSYTLEVLSDLRKELDQLHEFRTEDITGMTKEERDKCWDEAQRSDDTNPDLVLDVGHDEDPDEFDIEYAEVVAEAEKELQADCICLPIRSATQGSSDIDIQVQTPSISVFPPANDEQVKVTTRKLRRQKSANFSKGGAFHAQQFSKSLGKTGAKTRPSILDMNWAPENGSDKA